MYIFIHLTVICTYSAAYTCQYLSYGMFIIHGMFIIGTRFGSLKCLIKPTIQCIYAFNMY